MSEAVRHFVFDIGKVLIHYDPNLPFLRIIPDADERTVFFASVCTPDWNLEQDRGRSWSEAEALLVSQHPEREAQIRAFRRHWGRRGCFSALPWHRAGHRRAREGQPDRDVPVRRHDAGMAWPNPWD